MPTNADLSRRRTAAIPRGVGNMLQVYADRASNAEIWDVEGRRYIDFASGIAVLNTGHLHAKVQAAINAQMARLSHACFQVTPYENYVALAERLNDLVPGAAPKKTLFLTTGAEAIENSIKIARHHTQRSAVIAFSGGFHGRTLACMSLTGKVQPYKAGFGPMLPEVYHAPFPIDYHGVSTAQALAGLEQLFKADVDPARVAAIIVEPVQGEGGFYVAPPEFLRALRSICDTYGIVLIVDEIQTGFARTGRMFAIEHSGVEPDLVTLAKSLAGGVPLAAVTGKAAIMDSPPPGGRTPDRRSGVRRGLRCSKSLNPNNSVRGRYGWVPPSAPDSSICRVAGLASAMSAGSAPWWRWSSSKIDVPTLPMPNSPRRWFKQPDAAVSYCSPAGCTRTSSDF
jgi:4-aminobutyrate aminotransferase/(S)-3-amino-2-methylpropionate transaminase